MLNQNDIERIAVVCHEANRVYCLTLGDNSQLTWNDAPDWQRDSIIKGVEFCIANPSAPASANHDAWLEHKASEGWTYDPVKDAVTKTHPCMVSYWLLPVEQRRKDALIKAIVAALNT